MFLVPWLSWAAGLHVEMHTSRWLRIDHLAPAMRQLPLAMPCDVQRDRHGRKVLGLTPTVAEYTPGYVEETFR